MTHILYGMRQWTNSVIGSDGLLPGRRQVITWTNTGLLWIGPLGTKFSEIRIEIHKFWLAKMPLKMSSGKRRQSCLGFNMFKVFIQDLFRV